jgi:hypothetical protein
MFFSEPGVMDIVDRTCITMLQAGHAGAPNELCGEMQGCICRFNEYFQPPLEFDRKGGKSLVTCYFQHKRDRNQPITPTNG